MSKFSTNWALLDTSASKKTNLIDTEIISAEIKRKLKLIEKEKSQLIEDMRVLRQKAEEKSGLREDAETLKKMPGTI